MVERFGDRLRHEPDLYATWNANRLDSSRNGRCAAKYGRFDWDPGASATSSGSVKTSFRTALIHNGVDQGSIVNVPSPEHQGIEAGLNAELWNSKKVQDETGERVTLNRRPTH